MDMRLPVTAVDTAEYTINGKIRNLLIPNFQIILCKSGSGILFCENSLPKDFCAGDVIFIASSMLHGFAADNALLQCIAYNGEYAEYITEYFNFGYSAVVRNPLDNDNVFGDIINKETDNFDDDLNISCKLYELIIQTGIKQLKSAEPDSANDFIAAKVKRYITENYSKPEFSVQKLPQVFNIPGDELNAIFSDNTGMSIEVYSNLFCLHMVQNIMFLRPHLNLNRCVMTNGFKSFEEFNKSFYDTFGMSIEEYIS